MLGEGSCKGITRSHRTLNKEGNTAFFLNISNVLSHSGKVLFAWIGDVFAQIDVEKDKREMAHFPHLF